MGRLVGCLVSRLVDWSINKLVGRCVALMDGIIGLSVNWLDDPLLVVDPFSMDLSGVHLFQDDYSPSKFRNIPWKAVRIKTVTHYFNTVVRCMLILWHIFRKIWWKAILIFHATLYFNIMVWCILISRQIYYEEIPQHSVKSKKAILLRLLH